jgi:hypothetical protein
VAGLIIMNPQELIAALRELDRLYDEKDSFQAWLAGRTEALQTAYTFKKAEIENAFPGLRVVYTYITYKSTHALVAEDQRGSNQ